MCKDCNMIVRVWNKFFLLIFFSLLFIKLLIVYRNHMCPQHAANEKICCMLLQKCYFILYCAKKKFSFMCAPIFNSIMPNCNSNLNFTENSMHFDWKSRHLVCKISQNLPLFCKITYLCKKIVHLKNISGMKSTFDN